MKKPRFVVLMLPMLAAGLAAIALGQGQIAPSTHPAPILATATAPAAIEAASTMPATASAPASSPASAPASAASQAATSEPVILMPNLAGKGSASGGDDQGKLLWEMASRLIIVLALAVAAILVVKKLLPRLGRAPASSKKRVRIIETTYLGPKKVLHVVEVGSKRYLLAGCGDQVRFMTDVSEAFRDEDPKES